MNLDLPATADGRISDMRDGGIPPAGGYCMRTGHIPCTRRYRGSGKKRVLKGNMRMKRDYRETDTMREALLDGEGGLGEGQRGRDVKMGGNVTMGVMQM